MSGSATLQDAIRALNQNANSRAASGLPGLAALPPDLSGQAAKADPKAVAFQMQMRMAQQAMNVGDVTGEDEPARASRLDSGLINDALLMDALSTMARLTGQQVPQAAQPGLDQAALEKSLTRNPSAEGLGSVAALFESGEKGVAAIGFDRTGGTSYGKFQISSKAGTMGRFLNYLSEREPAWAERLRRSGPANTGSVQGRMPAEWGKIAAESPERFERLQTEFIKKDHYQPAREKILERTGVDIETARPALREALFSTAVQHGASGAARIFNQAIDKFLGHGGGQQQPSGGKAFEQALVSEVYAKRQNQFGGSTEAVRASVRGRLRQEKDMVLAMLERQKGVDRLA